MADETTPWERVGKLAGSVPTRFGQRESIPISSKVEPPPIQRPDPMRSTLAQIGVNVRKFEHARLEGFDPKPDRIALQAAEKFVERFLSGERPSLYLFSVRPGDRLAAGCGKTHLTVGIVRRIIERQPEMRDRIRFAYVPELIDDYRRQFNDTAPPENLDVKYLYPELLVMDDFGAQRLTEYAVETLNRIIYRREARSTIYTSNLPLEDIDAKDPTGYIERATSRIAGECQVVCLSGPDRRIARAV